MVVVRLILLGEEGNDLSTSDLQLTSVSGIEVGVVGDCVTELIRRASLWRGYRVDVKMPMTGDLLGRTDAAHTLHTPRSSKNSLVTPITLI